MSAFDPIRLGTRASLLAKTQSGHVARLLENALGRPVELVEVTTEGDVNAAPLASMGGTGVFVSALRAALAAHQVDVVVHSLKDLPTADFPGIVLAAVPEREDVRDVVVASAPLRELPAGARVGTGSPRRVAQIAALGLPIELVGVRGNVDTRIGKVASGELDGVVLAAAGLSRLGRLDEVTEYLSAETILPAPGQGALAVECREGDALTGQVAAALDHRETRACVTAERTVLALLEAGCSAPVGAHATIDDGLIRLDASVASLDGRRILREARSGQDPVALAREVADALLESGAVDLVAAASHVADINHAPRAESRRSS
ncbi:MAG: hydroxymethylbilane synthase [Marmoricola sp.]